MAHHIKISDLCRGQIQSEMCQIIMPPLHMHMSINFINAELARIIEIDSALINYPVLTISNVHKNIVTGIDVCLVECISVILLQIKYFQHYTLETVWTTFAFIYAEEIEISNITALMMGESCPVSLLRSCFLSVYDFIEFIAIILATRTYHLIHNIRIDSSKWASIFSVV